MPPNKALLCCWVLWGGITSATSLGAATPSTLEGTVPHRSGGVAPLGTVNPVVSTLIEWILKTHDHRNLPFVVVDKKQARAYVSNGQGRMMGTSPVLLGLMPGDSGVDGIGDRPLALIEPWERTTPAGRFVAYMANNVLGQPVLWVDYDQGISLHPVRSVDAGEKRMERLATPTPEDNRISYGCINVPLLFWRDVVQPAFMNSQGIVYVMPDTRTLPEVFDKLN